MMQTFWRLITNPTLMCNNLASVFYFLGYMPYWVFMAKYIETQYRQSASTSSLVTGTYCTTLSWGPGVIPVPTSLLVSSSRIFLPRYSN